jgi:histidinol-phosphate/aromatic aminotransferase/cobyric acid decarboxylase-like protein
MGASPRRLRDYCIPANPYFPTPQIFDSLSARLQAILKSYPSSNQEIATRLADFVGLDPVSMVLGNGSTELITWINRLIVTESLAVPVPTFSRWFEDAGLSGKTVHTFVRDPRQEFRLTPGEFVASVLSQGARAAVLCNPDDPTGTLLDPAGVLRVLEALADLDVVVIDESFIDFAAEEDVPSIEREVTRFPNAIVLKSLGKNLGLHGLRVGYAVAHPDLVGRLRAALPDRNLNSVAQALIEELATARDDYESGRRQVVRDRVYLSERLRTVPGLRVYPAYANFVYVRIPAGTDGVSLRNHLLVEHGCLLRECGNKLGSDSSYFRIAARPRAEVDQLIQCLGDSLATLGASPTPGQIRRGPLPADTLLATPRAASKHASIVVAPEPVIPSPEVLLRASLPMKWRRAERSPMTGALSGLLILALGVGAIALLRAVSSRAGAAPAIAAQPVAPDTEAPPSPPDPAPDTDGALPTTDQSEDQPQPPRAEAEPEIYKKPRLANHTKAHRKHTRARRDYLDEQEFASRD